MPYRAKFPGPDQWLQYLTLGMCAFLIAYLVTYAQNERERNDCREAVDRALIEAIVARQPATVARETALDALVDGLIAAPEDEEVAQRLLLQFRDARRQVALTRAEFPFPSPTCD